MITSFVNHGEIRDINKRIRYRVLERFFRHLVTRGRLKASPVPTMAWKRSEPRRTSYAGILVTVPEKGGGVSWR